jgi:hypothetical protein
MWMPCCNLPPGGGEPKNRALVYELHPIHPKIQHIRFHSTVYG